MIPVQIILIAIVTLVTDANGCNCTCDSMKMDVCDEQEALRSEVDNFAKWDRYYDFIRRLRNDWQNQVAYVVRQQLEENEALEGIKNVFLASQKEVSIQMNDLKAKMGIPENSSQTLYERGDELDLTMEMILNLMSGLRVEVLRLQPACTPPCDNGDQCMANNVCNCTFSFYGERCQDGPNCGVDNDGNNGGGNISSDLVWPWMAAVFSGADYVCSGSVIHRRFVLTSALCVDQYQIGQLSVKLGLSDLKKGTHLQEYRVRSVHNHPQRSYTNYDYGIVLLELKEAIPFGPFVSPVCLPPREIPQDETFYKPRTTANAVYLKDYFASPQTASPTMLNLTILHQEEYRKNIEENNWENLFPSPEISFSSESSSFTCIQWGSPLMQFRLAGDGTRTWTQVGILVFSNDCKFFFSPRLDRLRAWVDETIAVVSNR